MGLATRTRLVSPSSWIILDVILMWGIRLVIGAVLNLKPNAARVYLPPDANCFLSTLAHSLRSKNYVNLMVGSKQPTPVFLSPAEAEAHCRAGASVWQFASTDGGLSPDVVLVGIGAELTFEVVKAAELLRDMAPELRVRVVNVTDLMVLETAGLHPHSLTDEDFNALFTADRDVHFNYHGYAAELRGMLFARSATHRLTVEGYREEGSTTTPFDMMLLNHVSRFHVMEYALRGGARVNEKIRVRLVPLLAELKHRIQKTRDFIMQEGRDPDGTYDLEMLKGSGGGGVLYKG